MFLQLTFIQTLEIRWLADRMSEMLHSFCLCYVQCASYLMQFKSMLTSLLTLVVCFLNQDPDLLLLDEPTNHS